MREVWKHETYVRSQSFLSESAVKYLHIGRRKIQISPPPGEKKQPNAPPPAPPPPPPPLPAGFTLIGALFPRILAGSDYSRGDYFKYCSLEVLP